MVKCRKCGQGPMETADRGAYLNRVNEKGVTGIWECAPSCEHKHGGQNEALLAALEDSAPSGLVFELGKFYKHGGGQMMHMIAAAEDPVMWMGPTLIAESPEGNLSPCGMDTTNAQNWSEITKDEYMAQLKPAIDKE